MKILFTGGGTGGHIFPIIAVVREIKKIQFLASEQDKIKKEKIKLFYIGPADPFGEIFLSQEEIKIKAILSGKVRRYITPAALIQNFIDIFFKIPIGTLQAFFYIFLLAPDLIFSKGAYGSFPSVFAGWLLGIPVFLHESDSTPGFSNRVLSRFATLIFLSFPKTEYFPLSQIVLVGNPIRKEILEGSEKEAKRVFHLKREKPLILILGGSQGAQRINDLILSILPKLLEKFEVIHQCGENNLRQVKAEALSILKEERRQRYHLYPFLREEELRHAFRACDLIVCRAGSGSIFEIAAVQKPSILVPLPGAAQDHQSKNARSYAAKGAALIIEEVNLTPRFFLDRLEYLFSHPSELEKMKKEAIRFSQPEAAKIIAQDIVNYLL